MESNPSEPNDQQLIALATAFSQDYMSTHDASHDFTHIQRVLRLAKQIAAQEKQLNPNVDMDDTLIQLGALLHDVGDRKYKKDESETPVFDFLRSVHASMAMAKRVQLLVGHVSYSHEVREPAAVRTVLADMPELGVVQDADRLDALGAVGVARCLVFNGVKGHGMEAAFAHFDEKLVRLPGMMKTITGRRLAGERVERIKLFKAWWEEENGGEKVS